MSISVITISDEQAELLLQTHEGHFIDLKIYVRRGAQKLLPIPIVGLLLHEVARCVGGDDRGAQGVGVVAGDGFGGLGCGGVSKEAEQDQEEKQTVGEGAYEAALSG